MFAIPGLDVMKCVQLEGKHFEHYISLSCVVGISDLPVHRASKVWSWSLTSKFNTSKHCGA